MKSIIVCLFSLTLFVSAQAENINLSVGEKIRIGGDTISCTRNGDDSHNGCSKSENPYLVCLTRGYSPSTCRGLSDGCAAGQAICLTRGYSPSTCKSGAGIPKGGQCDIDENPYAVCMKRGYSPSTCKVLYDGCAAGQATCLTRGYSPSTCANQ